MSSFLAASAFCPLFLAPTSASQARQEKIKLTGTVTKLVPDHKPQGSAKASVVILKQGSKKVGKLIAYFEGSAGRDSVFAGTIKLRVGSVRGKHSVRFIFETTGNYCPPCSPPTYGTEPKFATSVIGSGGVIENVVVLGSGIPSKIGSKLKVVLVPAAKAERRQQADDSGAKKPFLQLAQLRRRYRAQLLT
jgi:hypothetical protein